MLKNISQTQPHLSFFLASIFSLTDVLKKKQMRMYRDFLEEHARQLLDIEDALDETLSDMWDSRHDPVAIKVSRLGFPRIALVVV